MTATCVGASDVEKANSRGEQQGPETVIGGQDIGNRNKTNISNITNQVLCLVNIENKETRLGHSNTYETY